MPTVTPVVEVVTWLIEKSVRALTKDQTETIFRACECVARRESRRKRGSERENRGNRRE
ncbi:hypothetical protein WN48_07215 [Eufriesea mexicana]|uniref:Uncharacterized protein n=1 Tax=Eufriesea mexicana TaxID=516756 RepID=A0A310SIZ6_9HYME|nr:hypothetical protein WN48_07215 [Eufriesea mexicana]